ncbi:MAG: hypothetical protein KKD44_27930 [Proteobacteria bacterium]|nr:hypothetical protein [Pseudomonadota bacterium]
MKATRFIRQLIWMLERWEQMWDVTQDEMKRRGEAERLGDLLEELDLPERGCPGAFKRGLAAWEIGQALWLADQYGIELHIGTSFCDCRAVLPKERWLHPIAPDADQWSYSFFIRQDPAKVTSIQAMSRWPTIAICQCVVNAKRAGVI